MSDDDFELRRLFAEADGGPADDAFVARVQSGIAWRGHRATAAMATGAVALLLAIWATWPVAYRFSRHALDGIAFLSQGLSNVLASQTGQLAVGALVVAAALWFWLYERLRGTAD